jgi:hypothetical protein
MLTKPLCLHAALTKPLCLQAKQAQFTAGGRAMSVKLSEEHLLACQSGLARMNMRLGNTTKGMQLAIECGAGMRPQASGVCGPKLLVYAALRD